MKKHLLSLLFAFASVSITFASGHVVTASATNTTCNGTCNASGYGIASGGVGPYGYSWANIGNQFYASGQIQQNLCAGTYTITAVDSSDMSLASYILTVMQPQQIMVTTNSQNSICAGTCSPLYATASGGTPPYTYSWSPSAGLSSPNSQTTMACPTNITTYMVTVTDGNGCTQSGYNVILVNQPPVVNVTTSSSNCGLCSGYAAASASGGTSYSWAGPNNYTSSAATIGNLCAGTYTVTASNSTGCFASATGTVNNTSSITNVTISTIQATCGNADGTVSITGITGGNPPYIFSWNNGGTTQTITNVPAGTYTATIYDQNQCSYTASATVANSGGPISASIGTTPSGCTTSTGSINVVVVVGGISPYTYSINGGAFTPNTLFSGLAAGVYQVAVLDSGGCIYTQVITVPSSSNPPVITVDSTNNISCSNGILGNIYISVTGGAGGYTYLWSPGAFTTQDYTNITNAGGCYVIVTDAGGCTAIHQFSISNTSTLYGTVTTTYGNCGTLATATAAGNGGTSPYSYVWNTSPAQTTATATNLTTGYYQCTITDAAGCIRTIYAYVYNNCYNVIRGRVYNDVNGNCIFDAGDSPIAYRSVWANNGLGYNGYGYSDANGYYTIYTTLMTNTVTHSNPTYSSVLCPAGNTQTVTFTNLGDTINNVDFADQFLNNVNDLQVAVYAGNARPGFQQWVYIYYYNAGTTTINGATITLTHDSILSYISSSPASASYSYPDVTYNLGTVNPGQYGYIYAYMQVPIISNGGYIGRLLNYSAQINPIPGDFTPANNVSSAIRTITNSYDPNLKEVEPTGNITSADSILKYTIHFQNMGNDTAFTVVVKDTLSQYLDASTVEAGIASHPYNFNIGFDGVLTWTFNNILLPDSTTNETASNGFLTYTVKQKHDNSPGIHIDNTASIYFDFNDGITTNTVRNDLVDIATSIVNNSSNGDVRIYPNPSSGKFQVLSLKSKVQSIMVMDVLGKTVIQSSIINHQSSIDLTSQPSGIYFYKVTSADGTVSTGKLIKR